MSSTATEPDVRSLQRRAEQAIRAAKPRDTILRLLEQLLAAAPDGTEPSRFAHRHLAELRLEESPWRAALHLRRVLTQDPDDDIAQALMGLCQALQANFKSAVAAYRRAVALSPTNPWYNHNLGHLLDVALRAPRDALPYLRRAYKLEPSQDEVAASLAHCLGRLGTRDEALEIAKGLVARNPKQVDHRSLLRWIEKGSEAGGDSTVPGLLSAISPGASGTRTNGTPAVSAGALSRKSTTDRAETPGDSRAGEGPEVERILADSFATAGRAGTDLERARLMWRDYARIAHPVLGRPTVLAAALEYALTKVDGVALKQKDIALRHGVSVSSLQNRYAAIRSVLHLQTNDSRYARAARRKRDDEPN